jgi:hypothetical protein
MNGWGFAAWLVLVLAAAGWLQHLVHRQIGVCTAGVCGHPVRQHTRGICGATGCTEWERRVDGRCDGPLWQDEANLR